MPRPPLSIRWVLLIHHLSYPYGDSVNDLALCSVWYASLDAAVGMIRVYGLAALLSKCDIKSAFQLLHFIPEGVDLLGFWFEEKFYFDKLLSMGCSISFWAFQYLPSKWCASARTSNWNVMHYLDDFLFARKKNASEDLLHFCNVLYKCHRSWASLWFMKNWGPRHNPCLFRHWIRYTTSGF